MTKERFQALSIMTPVQGVSAWLKGDFDAGEGPALLKVIRKDGRVTLPDDELLDFLCDAATAGEDAQACFDELTAKNQ